MILTYSLVTMRKVRIYNRAGTWFRRLTEMSDIFCMTAYIMLTAIWHLPDELLHHQQNCFQLNKLWMTKFLTEILKIEKICLINLLLVAKNKCSKVHKVKIEEGKNYIKKSLRENIHERISSARFFSKQMWFLSEKSNALSKRRLQRLMHFLSSILTWL